MSNPDSSPFAEGRSRGELSVDGVRCPRTWSRKPCPGRRVEKASWLTKEPRMESSVASSCKGPGVITRAVRRGRGVPPSKTPQWSAVRRAGLRKAGTCSFAGARSRHLRLLRRSAPSFKGANETRFRLAGANRKENVTLARKSAARARKRGCLKFWIWKKGGARSAGCPAFAGHDNNYCLRDLSFVVAREGGRSSLYFFPRKRREKKRNGRLCAGHPRLAYSEKPLLKAA
jgi:hypothetical protein